ncbi:efflux RND transporter permease subunit [Candidatus Saccharibacteria bacterium]|nr:efflux RND transporter permease subunit [Candidatus Saccharibacteria bacterium]
MAKQLPIIKTPKDKLLPRMTLFFFDKARLTALVWLAVTVFGIASYTTLLRREGFPSVNIPIAIVGGGYFVNDPIKVDNEAAKPISEIALDQPGVSSVQTESAANFFTVSVQYTEGTDSKVAAAELEQKVKESGRLPESVKAQYNVPYFGATGGDTRKLDVAISFFAKDNNVPTKELAAKAEEAATKLRDKNLPLIQEVFVKSPYENVTDPSTGQSVVVQQSFDRFGERDGDENRYSTSVIIGVAAVENADVLKLDEDVRRALDELQKDEAFTNYNAEVSASFAPQIEENISELQRVLLEGLVAVLVVGSIVIAIRASLITVVSMITVLLAALGFLYLIGYSLNVITLFALILALALIVDDTIIMVEAIDAARHHHRDRRKAVLEATRKVSRAMLAATMTAALSFAPLLFVGGVLGSFIQAIPVTIIAALLLSLVVALVFIPFFARSILLSKKQMGTKEGSDTAAGFEMKIANFFARPMLWARNSRMKLFAVGGIAVLIGSLFIGAGLFIARDVVFNIFPPTKDTNGLILQMNFPQGTTVEQAEAIAGKADELASEVLGDKFEHASYFMTGGAQSAVEQIQIVSYNNRDVTSPELVTSLQEKFDTELTNARVSVGQLDVGPPSQAFIIQLDASDRDAAFKAAGELKTYLSGVELTRVSGKVARLTNVSISSPDQYIRTDGKPIINVSAGFDGNDTTTLVTLAQDTVKKEFTNEKLATYGLTGEAINFDLGQESENQDSFKTLALAFPIMLLVMYVLLAAQFRSFLQPLLIFMAIPFSIFGIMLGLKLTDNAISFFALLGFFALVGLSIKNTILLTDFANQARRQNLSAIDSAVAALRERFRPLFATSVTAVVSLIPLAISSPFWEGLAVVLIFGLLSSTFLVVAVFPYYYLGAEFLRTHISATQFFAWVVPTIVTVILVSKFVNLGLALLIVPISLLIYPLQRYYVRRLN